MVAWPTDNLTKDEVDNNLDSPLIARQELEALIDKVKVMISAVSSSNVVSALMQRDSNGDSALRYITALKLLGDVAASDGTVVLDSGTNGDDATFSGGASSAANITVTVGSGGDYSTINAALAYLSQFHPRYVSGGYTATINLLTGFVMAEQVYVSGIDLSWITIDSVDSTVSVTRSALTTQFENKYSAFAAYNGSLPKIDTVFVMDTTGTASTRTGVFVTYNSSVVFGDMAGFTHAGSYNVFASDNSRVACGQSCLFSNSGTGIAVEQSSIFSGMSVFGSYNACAIRCTRGSLANVRGMMATGLTGTEGVYAEDASAINIDSGTIAHTGSLAAVTSRDSSTVNVQTATVTSTGLYEFRVTGGATMNTYGTTGTPSQTINTLYNAGIIYAA